MSTPRIPHQIADVICAWANGFRVEFRYRHHNPGNPEEIYLSDERWHLCGTAYSAWSGINEHRIHADDLAAWVVFNAQPKGTPDMRDAYVGAREDLADWKRRALAAEKGTRRLDCLLNDFWFGGATEERREAIKQCVDESELIAFLDEELAANPSLAPAVQAPAPTPAKTIKLGSYGQAFDLPGDRRAYTYKHQPGNQVAWRLGDASSRVEAGGDLIDRGLSLLKVLEAGGFGVFDLDETAIAVPAPAVVDGTEPLPQVIAERDEYASELARCRDAFPIPEAGTPLDGPWQMAMGDPLAVADYVTACLAQPPVHHTGEQA